MVVLQQAKALLFVLDRGDSYTITVRPGKLENDLAIDAEATIDRYYETQGPRMVLSSSWLYSG